MTKPCAAEELLARIKALTRRKGEVMLDETAFAEPGATASAFGAGYTALSGVGGLALGIAGTAIFTGRKKKKEVPTLTSQDLTRNVKFKFHPSV